jgi:hypothetical protein
MTRSAGKSSSSSIRRTLRANDTSHLFFHYLFKVRRSGAFNSIEGQFQPKDRRRLDQFVVEVEPWVVDEGIFLGAFCAKKEIGARAEFSIKSEVFATLQG